MAGYHKLTYIVVSLLVIGLLFIILLCYRALGHTISPLYQLLDKTQIVASGNMEVYIPRTTRTDVIGRLQNSFASMLESLNFHMGSVRYISEQTQRRNEELLHATQMVQEADRQKTAFIQNVTHQIRTPLNIIMGFTQVISDAGSSSLSDEDKKSVTDTMSHNAKQLARMVQMLFDSSDSGLSQELDSHKNDHVSCNDVAREAISFVKQHYPEVHINMDTQLGDDFCIQTNRLYLMRALRELLYNSAKYSDGQHVVLRISLTHNTVNFIVEDTGKGISEADSEQLFKFFTKVDDLSEGLGLGLPLAKRHAQNLGGDITFDPTYHTGCRFILTTLVQ